MNFNPHNFGIAYGALAAMPRFRQNKDGSNSVQITVAIHDSNSEQARYLDFRRYIPIKASKLLENFQSVTTGSFVYINYHPEKVNFLDKNNKKVYRTNLVIDRITFLTKNNDQKVSLETNSEPLNSSASSDFLSDFPFN